ncbi:hypothetical protein [Enterobacter cloacae]|uniref:hypothetical protein n=1 Tax=Enterobacter cloacae TaxID=550 RepID=UPI00388E3B44
MLDGALFSAGRGEVSGVLFRRWPWDVSGDLFRYWLWGCERRFVPVLVVGM